MDKGNGMSGLPQGEWYLSEWDNGEFTIDLKQPDGDVRRIGEVNTAGDEHDDHTAESRRIGLCMAAAPDLLEACKASEEAAQAAIAASEACPDGQRIPEHEAQRVDALYMRAEKLRRAAIKKATQ